MTKSYTLLSIVFYLVVVLISSVNAQSSKNYDKELRRLNAKIDRVRVLVDSLEFNDRLLLPELMAAFRQAVSSKSQQDSITVVIMKRINTLNNKIAKLENQAKFMDSTSLEIYNKLVMIENKIESLIASYKEMTEISGKKKTRVIPKITDEEYQAKYIEALSNYQNAEWNLSLDGFKFLIQADSNHDLADNCQYWIGEVYYSLKDYRRSIKEFEKVFTFPGTNKSDDAQFKLGLCYVNIGQIDKGKQEFKNLLEFYPNSEYYKRSQEYLQKY